MRRTAVLPLAILLIACGFTVNRTQACLDRHREIRFVDRRPVFLPRGEVLKWMSMGYRGLMGDWLWIRTVLYYGRRVVDHDNRYLVYAESRGDTTGLSLHRALHHRGEEAEEPGPLTPEQIRDRLRSRMMRAESRGLVEYVYPMLDRVTTVDPRFVFPYLFGGLYVLMDTGDGEAAYRLLEKGRRQNPERWEFPFYLGWLEWMFRGDLEKTSSCLMEALEKPDCPGFVGELLTGLSRNLGQEETTLLYLNGLLESTENPEIRGRIETVLEALSPDD